MVVKKNLIFVVWILFALLFSVCGVFAPDPTSTDYGNGCRISGNVDGSSSITDECWSNNFDVAFEADPSKGVEKNFEKAKAKLAASSNPSSIIDKLDQSALNTLKTNVGSISDFKTVSALVNKLHGFGVAPTVGGGSSTSISEIADSGFATLSNGFSINFNDIGGDIQEGSSISISETQLKYTDKTGQKIVIDFETGTKPKLSMSGGEWLNEGDDAQINVGDLKAIVSKNSKVKFENGFAELIQGSAEFISGTKVKVGNEVFVALAGGLKASKITSSVELEGEAARYKVYSGREIKVGHLISGKMTIDGSKVSLSEKSRYVDIERKLMFDTANIGNLFIEGYDLSSCPSGSSCYATRYIGERKIGEVKLAKGTKAGESSLSLLVTDLNVGGVNSLAEFNVYREDNTAAGSVRFAKTRDEISSQEFNDPETAFINGETFTKTSLLAAIDFEIDKVKPTPNIVSVFGNNFAFRGERLMAQGGSNIVLEGYSNGYGDGPIQSYVFNNYYENKALVNSFLDDLNKGGNDEGDRNDLLAEYEAKGLRIGTQGSGFYGTIFDLNQVSPSKPEVPKEDENRGLDKFVKEELDGETKFIACNDKLNGGNTGQEGCFEFERRIVDNKEVACYTKSGGGCYNYNDCTSVSGGDSSGVLCKDNTQFGLTLSDFDFNNAPTVAATQGNTKEVPQNLADNDAAVITGGTGNGDLNDREAENLGDANQVAENKAEVGVVGGSGTNPNKNHVTSNQLDKNEEVIVSVNGKLTSYYLQANGEYKDSNNNYLTSQDITNSKKIELRRTMTNPEDSGSVGSVPIPFTVNQDGTFTLDKENVPSLGHLSLFLGEQQDTLKGLTLNPEEVKVEEPANIFNEIGKLFSSSPEKKKETSTIVPVNFEDGTPRATIDGKNYGITIDANKGYIVNGKDSYPAKNIIQSRNVVQYCKDYTFKECIEFKIS